MGQKAKRAAEEMVNWIGAKIIKEREEGGIEKGEDHKIC